MAMMPKLAQLGIIGGLLLAGTAHAQIARDLVIVPQNEASGVSLNLSASALTVPIGGEISFCFTAGRSGYATLWNRGTSGRVQRIFPYTQQEGPAAVVAGQQYCAGTPNESYMFRVGGPPGMEDVYLAWSQQPGAQPDGLQFNSGEALSKDLDVLARQPTNQWASAKVTYEIVDPTRPPSYSPPIMPTAPAPGGRVWILAMGSNVGLTKTNDDAQRIAGALQSRHQVPANQVRLIQNATRAQFSGGMDWLAYNAMPGDLVYVFFSGHGTNITDDNGDESDGLDEAFVTFDMNGQNSLTRDRVVVDDEFAQMMQKLRTDRIVTIIDACFSGGLYKSLDHTVMGARNKFLAFPGQPPAQTSLLTGAVRRDLAGGVDSNIGGFNATVKGVVIAAAQETQSALELQTGGLLTTTLLEQMSYADTMATAVTKTSGAIERATKRQQIPTTLGNLALLQELRLR